MPKIKGTQSEVRKHAYVSFTDRVASIRIDPIRKLGTKKSLDEDVQSYFIAAFEQWRELNLTTNFSEFSEKCWPLCQSLPLLIHNQKEVSALLLEHSAKADLNSIEPMLDLVSHFARDMGEDFEPYFADTLTMLIELASVHGNIDANLLVIEKTFQCQAYLFKYLARLLTTDLRPTFDLVAALFGKDQRQRSFVLRFAAESMAFLVRKCSGESLTTIIHHIVKTVEEQHNEQYFKSTQMLLANTLKSTGNVLHSKASAIISEVLNAANELGTEYSGSFAGDILVDVLHHTRKDTAEPLYKTVGEFVSQIKESSPGFAFHLLFTVAGLRKGDRVNDWNALWTLLIDVLTAYDADVELSLSGVLATSTIITVSEFQQTTKNFDKVLKLLLKRPSSAIEVFQIVHDLNQDVFTTFIVGMAYPKLLPLLNTDEASALLLLHTKVNGSSDKLKISSAKQAELKKLLNSVPVASEELFDFWWRYRAFSKLLPGYSFPEKVFFAILDMDVEPEYRGFQSQVVGEILGQIKLTDAVKSRVVARLPALELRSGLFKGLLESFGGNKTVSSLSSDDRKSIIDVIGAGAMSWDKDTRRAAIEFCGLFIDSDMINTAGMIDDIPYDATNARTLAMHIRNLAGKYSVTPPSAELDIVIPRFFFGILSSRFQPVWKAVLEAMPKLADKSAAMVWELAYLWINEPPTSVSMDQLVDTPEAPELQLMECTFLSKVQENGRTVWAACHSPRDTLLLEAAEAANIQDFDDLRSVAIKALIEVPKAAEAHADTLAPLLLLGGDVEDAAAAAYKDKLTLLELFSKFTKPKKMSKFQQVYERYLYFLGSKHVPIQRLALKCVLSVNDSQTGVLRKYRDNLNALTDDARFKDEVTSFFSEKGSGQEDAMHDEDRELVIPIALRIMYGRAQISKATGGTKSNQRHAVLSALHYYVEEQYQIFFLQLATSQVKFDADSGALRRQQGLVSLLQDYVKELQTKTAAGLDVIVHALIDVFRVTSSVEDADDEEQEEEEEVSERHIYKITKNLRQSSIKVLTTLFTVIADQTVWNKYFPDIYATLISPRMESFARLNLQQPSALFKLMTTLSTDVGLLPYLAWDDGKIVHAIVSTLNFDTVKEPVAYRALEVVDRLLETAPVQYQTVLAQLVASRFSSLLTRGFSANFLAVLTTVLNKLITLSSANFSQDINEKLIAVTLQSLDQPSTLMPIAVKASLLDAIAKLLLTGNSSDEMIERAFTSLAKLFKQFSDRKARTSLSECYRAFGVRIPKYALVGELVVELNSFEARRLGIPDFDRRLKAFALLNESKYPELSAEEWNVILYNMLFFIKDPEELALRNNAAYSLKRFVDRIALSKSSEEAAPLVAILKEVALPAVRIGLRESNETFRTLYIEVLAHVVETVSNDYLPELSDMSVLLFDGDVEANFFYNIYHIQVHRRRRAVQRLRSLADEGKLGSNSISHYLLPMVEHFVALSGNKDGELNNLAEDAIQMISAVALRMTWNQFKAVSKRYVSEVINRPLEIKKTSKLITAMGTQIAGSTLISEVKESALVQWVLNDVVAPLHTLMTRRSNEDQNLPERISLAVPIVLYINALPQAVIENNLPGKLTWLCQVLRTKVQELRDLVRSTLGRVARILGPQYLVFIVSELKSALRNGAQLHVLGYTVHSLLVEVKNTLKHGELDSTTPIVSRILMEDIFGSTGEQKDSDGYVTGAKEVKQNKSFDSAEILATNISLARFQSLLDPVREFLLYTKVNLKAERKVEDLLRRISVGVQHNSEFKSQESLVLGYQVYDKATQTQKDEELKTKKTKEKVNDRRSAIEQAAKESEEFYTVRLSSRHWQDNPNERRTYARNLHLLQSFALDVLRSVLSSEESLLNPSNVKGLLPVMGDALKSKYEDIQMSGLRLATSTLKLPMADIDDTLNEFAGHALDLMKTTSASSSELFQATLKFLSMLFKQKQEFEMDELAVGYILDRVKPDVEEPDKQGVTITFVRAILSRKMLIPQVYSIMDLISRVMVTNQNAMTRSSCRSAFLQFLLDYPHGKTRLDKHFAFLVSNLQYSSASGRLSVMEMIHMILRKVDETQIEGLITSFFVGLVLVLVNDDVSECRSTASTLLKTLLTRATGQSKKVVVDYAISWLNNLGSNDLLVRGGLEVVALLVDLGSYMDEFPQLREQVERTVKTILKASAKASNQDMDWQLIYFALQYYSKRPKAPSAADMELVDASLLFPHPWVRAVAGRLFGLYYTSVKQNGASNEESAEFVSHIKKFVRQMGAPRLAEADSVQIVKNIVFLFSYWKTHELPDIQLKDGGEESALVWVVRKVSGSIRSDINDDEKVGSKTAAIQILASLAQLLDVDQVQEIALEAVTALYLAVEQLDERHQELHLLAQEALTIFDKVLGTTEYLKVYSAAKEHVQDKRLERKTKRSVEAVNEPALHARKRMKKNFHKKEVRQRRSKAMKGRD